MNTKKIQKSKYKVGLGFGGDDYNNYRIWLDDDLEHGSYSSSEDTTYERGYLADPSIREFTVKLYIVAYERFMKLKFGVLEDPKPWKNERFSESKRIKCNLISICIDSRIESQRKVDRKAFLATNFDKEMFFQKTFHAANNRDEQTDFREEMQ